MNQPQMEGVFPGTESVNEGVFPGIEFAKEGVFPCIPELFTQREKAAKQPEKKQRSAPALFRSGTSDGRYNSVQNADAGGITARPDLWVTLEKRQPVR